MLVFFEITTLPMLFIIFMFGSQPELRLACYYLGVYSLVGGLPLIVGVGASLGLEEAWVVEKRKRRALLLFPFLVKLPSYFFHLWLPQAHVEAPTEGRMVLASVILKLGSFGLFRLRLNLGGFLFLLRVVGALLAPLIALTQRDVKGLVAYRSVAHMAVLRLSLWCLTVFRFLGRWVVQVRHGFVSALLFFMVGNSSHKKGRRLLYFSSDGNFVLFFICCMFNAGAPISLSFLGEVCFFSSLLGERGLGMTMLLATILLTTLFNLHLVLSSLSRKERVEGKTLLPLLWSLDLLLLYWSYSLVRI